MKRASEAEPTFLFIRWEAGQDDEGGPGPREASLCRSCREKVARKFPSARGWGKRGDVCELCENRRRR